MEAVHMNNVSKSFFITVLNFGANSGKNVPKSSATLRSYIWVQIVLEIDSSI